MWLHVRVDTRSLGPRRAAAAELGEEAAWSGVTRMDRS